MIPRITVYRNVNERNAEMYGDNCVRSFVNDGVAQSPVFFTEAVPEEVCHASRLAESCRLRWANADSEMSLLMVENTSNALDEFEATAV